MEASAVSVILPVYNAEKWLDQCLQSVYEQTFTGRFELSVFNDASQDSSMDILENWRLKLEKRAVVVTRSDNENGSPKGVGYAKNQAFKQSSGKYLCFLDADDVMHQDRISQQLRTTQVDARALVGCQFHRLPEGSTVRYTHWANNLTPEQLYTQAYTSHGPTLIMPTWFCSREAYLAVGGFDERGKGTPEDLIFFYKHLELGGELRLVQQDLLMYRYHPEATTFSVLEDTIWELRVKFLEKMVLSKWSTFTIWNAGKQGRKLYRSLSDLNRKKVVNFCDVDEKKIQKQFYTFEDSSELPKPKVPIVHFTQAQPPLIICVKMDLTGGGFEVNLSSLHLCEGKDYIHFN
ncbi:queuosine-tRNA galactosyltransferase-like isoform X2 [Liolophura sinensis]|uniref:queuosine-tRNA galactosyltransferase-like isoform X2 n=1 Tax=Liolophura sinensis TaxID=3198878 RepID=UPI0031581262